MNYTRITAHFNTVENAKMAHRFLLKQYPHGNFTNIYAKNKKVSIENDKSEKLKGMSKSQIDVLMTSSRHDVLRWLDKCKGLSYIVLVSQ